MFENEWNIVNWTKIDGESIVVEEPLNTVLHRDFVGGAVVFGNSGLVFHFGRLGYACLFDYAPDAKDYYDEKNSPKYAAILATALLELHSLLNDPAKIKYFGIRDYQVVGKACAIDTNKDFIDKTIKLFSRSNVPDIAQRGWEKDMLLINLRLFKNLNNEDPLMAYLKRISRFSKDVNVRYHKSILDLDRFFPVDTFAS